MGPIPKWLFELVILMVATFNFLSFWRSTKEAFEEKTPEELSNRALFTVRCATRLDFLSAGDLSTGRLVCYPEFFVIKTASHLVQLTAGDVLAVKTTRAFSLRRGFAVYHRKEHEVLSPVRIYFSRSDYERVRRYLGALTKVDAAFLPRLNESTEVSGKP